MNILLKIIKDIAGYMAVHSLSEVTIGNLYQPKVDEELKSKIKNMKK